MINRQRHRISTESLNVLIFLILILLPTYLCAAIVSGTVKDPSGAVIPQATIEITGPQLGSPLKLVTDGQGRFTSEDLKPGDYVVRVAHEGFETLQQKISLTSSSELQFTLAIARQETQVTVPAQSMQFANSDPLYRELRSIGLGETFRLDNFTLKYDVGTFSFEKGTLTWLRPVQGVVTGAVFMGQGHFHLKAVTSLDRREIARRTGSDEVDEDFTQVIFRFNGEQRRNLLLGMGAKTEPSPDALKAFEHWRERARHRREVPLGFTDSLLDGDSMDNVDADVLAAVYNRNHPAFFNAYLRGVKHQDLRFFVRMRVGAIPQLDSPEEVALINFDPEGMSDGVWYLAHLKTEYEKGVASSQEDRRLFATLGYKIETVIAKNQHLFSSSTVTFKPLVEGERILKFGLLPTLRVTRVMDEQGQNLHFIQESRKEDGSFYVVLPQAASLGKSYAITIEYKGDKVLEQAGEGCFYVRARTSWYPNLNGFGEHSLYDLTFKVPKAYKVVSVGRLKDESIDGDIAITHWVTPIPVAVAGFNYGEYKKVEIADDITHYNVSGYYLPELPDNLRNYRALQSMAPSRMTKYALEQARAELQICTSFFGKSPYEDLYITEQPDFNFGQSWPNLVYLPISAYTDSTQRWMLFGNIDDKFTGFVREVTPHEVAHQWWGHTVGWASYHDQWLSEGFAEFSAALFLQNAVGPDWRKEYVEFWDRLRQRVLDKNNFGISPNDAGPIWMGTRLISPRTANAYQNVTYPKGAYVLAMLRSIMYDTDEKDKAFIEMMHDFVDTHRDRSASTESFKATAEKHMTKLMDIRGDHKLDWFFDEWVYGTQVPRYKFSYQVTPSDAGKVKLHLDITQSEVDDKFAMLVPVYGDFGKGWIRIGQARVIGSSTRTADVTLPAAPKKIGINTFKEILER